MGQYYIINVHIIWLLVIRDSRHTQIKKRRRRRRCRQSNSTPECQGISNSRGKNNDTGGPHWFSPKTRANQEKKSGLINLSMQGCSICMLERVQLQVIIIKCFSFLPAYTHLDVTKHTHRAHAHKFAPRFALNKFTFEQWRPNLIFYSLRMRNNGK